MAEPKTKRNDGSVTAFLNRISDESRRADAFAVMALMQDVTGERPQMWGTSIVGFGSYRAVGSRGMGNEWPLIGFAPRKQNLTLYLMASSGQHDSLLKKLGKHKVRGSCIHINRLDDIHTPTLRSLIKRSFAANVRWSKKSAAK